MLVPLGPGPEDLVEAASGLEERLRDGVAREQEFRHEAIPEVDRELAAQAEERGPPMLRNRSVGLTPMERDEHCRTHQQYRARCHGCIAGRGRADPHAMKNESEKGLPMVGVDHGCLQNRPAGKAGDFVAAEDDDGDPPDGVRTSTPVLCRRNSRDGWILSYWLQSKGNSGRNIAVFSQELMPSGYRRQIVRPDGEAAMVSRRSWRRWQKGRGSHELIQKQTSKGQIFWERHG